jgi:arginase family enzyme
MPERKLARMLHGEVPTLLEAPLAEDNFSGVVLLGVPYEGILVADRHTLYPPGSRPPESFYARFGADEAPDSIRRASIIYSLEHEGGVAAECDFSSLVERMRIVDAGNHTLEGAEAVAHKAGQAGGVPIALGGDHLVPLPLVRGLQQGRPRRLGAVILDSHLDLHPSPPAWAGSQWRTLIQEGYLRPEDMILVGARGVRQSRAEREYAHLSGMRVIPLREIDDRGLSAICQELGQRLQGVDGVYLSLDVDVIDPSFCPAQKYPDAGGMLPREVFAVMRAATGAAPLAGFDLCCFSPRYDEGQRGALLAARLILEAVYACLP